MKLKISPLSADDLVIRTMSANDIPSFMALYHLSFEDRPSEKYIRWRYFNTPVGMTPTMIALDNNVCVATYSAWPTPLMVDGNEVMAAQGIDAMTHPSFRGQGLFVQLGELCYEEMSKHGYQVLYGFPNDNSYPRGVRHLNWDHICNIPGWVRPLWIFGTSPLSGIAAATSLLWSTGAKNGAHVVSQVPNLDMITALAERNEKNNGCQVKRGREWFAWRYHPDSDRDYRWVAAYVGTALTGLGVWRFDPVTRKAFLCELVGDAESNHAVLNTILRAAYEEKARGIKCQTNDAAIIAHLKAQGFIRKSHCRLVVRSLTGKPLPEVLHTGAAWRILSGDLDYF